MIVFDRIISSIQQAGGVTVMFNELTSRLIDNGIDFIEYGYNKNEVDRINYCLLKKRYFERYRNINITFDEISPKSIFHSTCYRLPINSKFSVVTTVYDFTYEKIIKGVPAIVHTWQKNKAIRGSDIIVCISESTKNDLLHYVPDVDESKVVVVHLGVSDSYRVLDGSGAKPYVLFVGQRVKYKNFTNLVEALSNLSDIELVCVGGGVFTSAEKAFLDFSLGKRYRHTGYINESALNVFYNEALCLVYPSLYEGFGIPIIEAMRAGCPVIAVNTSSIPEVGGEAALLVETGNAEELRLAIMKMLDMEFRRKCVEAGLLQAKKFSWDRCYSELMEVYKNIGSV